MFLIEYLQQHKNDNIEKANNSSFMFYNFLLFIMDGKPSIKIMNKIQLLSTLKHGNSQGDIKTKYTKKISVKKRGSTPLISTSISAQKKGSHSSTIRKLPINNFITSNNTFAIASCKRIIQCHTATLPRKTYKKQQSFHKTEAQKLLLKNSDKIQKFLWNQTDQNLPPLIISGDFIMDQDAFWSGPIVNPSINKIWKILHKNYYVIWIVRLQKGFKKLKDYAQQNQLPLNAVYYHKRALKYTIDFTPIRKQLNKVYGPNFKQVVYFQSLKLNTKNVLQYGSFQGRIPIMLDNRFKIIYIRSDQNGYNFQDVYCICKSFNQIGRQKIRQILCVKHFISQFINSINQTQYICPRKINQSLLMKQNIQYEFVNQQQAQKQVQNFRRQLVESVIKQKGRNYQFQGFSTHYFVGDIIKRNYDILLQNAMKRLKRKQIKFHRQQNKQIDKLQNLQINIMEQFYQYFI